MPCLIDGHNLIPYIDGLSLTQIDDELELIEILTGYFKRQRKKAVLYFDRAQPGGSPDIKRAFLKVHFVRPPAIADGAILRQLKNMGGEAKNWTVVSSDQEIRRCAEKMGAEVISSAEFADAIYDNQPKQIKKKPSGDDDIADWLKIFGDNSKK